MKINMKQTVCPNCGLHFDPQNSEFRNTTERHGKWKVSYDLAGLCYLECSECGLQWVVDDGPEDNEMYYCPKCGAKMDEVSE